MHEERLLSHSLETCCGIRTTALVNGAAGQRRRWIVALAPDGPPTSVVGFTVRLAKIVEIEVLADRVPRGPNLSLEQSYRDRIHRSASVE